MIFEDITDNYNKTRRSNQNQTILISKYVELKKYNQIFKKSNKLQKQKLLRPKVKRKILRIIHDELNKKLKPEETFEIWHNDSNSKDNDSKSTTKTKKRRRKKKNEKDQMEDTGDEESMEDSTNDDDPLISVVHKYLDTKVPITQTEFHEQDQHASDTNDSEDSENDEYSNDKYNEFDIKSSHLLDTLTNEFDTNNTTVKTKFIIESSGMEILPNDEIFKQSMTNKHVNNLNTLLHFNILRKNWGTAYRIFCIIIRFPMVDVRLIWPLGVEILTQLSEQQPTKDSSTYQLKITRFFNYLNSFYLVNYRNQIALEVSDRSSLAPTWRVGTKNLTPIYLITSLWYLFVAQRDYESILNRISELILVPPYHDEGVLYFICILCYLSLSIQIVNLYNLQSFNLTKFNELEENEFRSYNDCVTLLKGYKDKSHKDMETCLKLNFIIPVDEIISQWKFISNELKTIEAARLSKSSKKYSDSVVEAEIEDELEEKTVADSFDYPSNGVKNDHENNFDFDIEDDETKIEYKSTYDDSPTRIINNSNENDMEVDFDDWGDIESDRDEQDFEKHPIIDTSTQQKSNNGVHKNGSIKNAGYEMDKQNDDWSNIQSDSENDEANHPEIENTHQNNDEDLDYEVNLENGQVSEVNSSQVNGRNDDVNDDEWANIDTDVEEEEPEKQVADTQEDNKDNYNNIDSDIDQYQESIINSTSSNGVANSKQEDIDYDFEWTQVDDEPQLEDDQEKGDNSENGGWSEIESDVEEDGEVSLDAQVVKENSIDEANTSLKFK
ncbi:RRN11 [Candida jiufengensis]|uniref:RRN11 n=1 Tax=Candida jiufengensis TaxID=497108 RepID=UPI002224F8F0|nr:RRN11 [Candida jiufengensis]KAI5954591.1 RRN11 [Candida jiufengensis]